MKRLLVIVSIITVLLPNTSIAGNNTAYHCAIETSQTDELAEQAIRTIHQQCKNEEPIDEICNDGNTLLMSAAKKGFVNTVRTLLSFGAQRSIKKQGGLTALHIALQQTTVNTELVKALVSQQENVHSRKIVNPEIEDIKNSLRMTNAHVRTPLYVAAIRLNRPDLIRILHAAGADIWERDDLNNTLLHLAISRGNMLTERGDLDDGDISAELERDDNGNLEAAKCLIELGGADLVNAASGAGDTPLQRAILVNNENRLELVAALLAGGAHVDKESYDNDAHPMTFINSIQNNAEEQNELRKMIRNAQAEHISEDRWFESHPRLMFGACAILASCAVGTAVYFIIKKINGKLQNQVHEMATKPEDSKSKEMEVEAVNCLY